MINAVVFGQGSHGLFLESLDKNANGTFNCIEVQDSTTFKEDLLKALSIDLEYTAMFNKDNILFSQIVEEDIVKALSDEDVFCFSLRLGENTTYCHTLQLTNTLHGQERDGNIIKWEWSKHYLDYGYPLSTNGHIFRTKELFKLIKKIPFTDCVTLEENIQVFEFLPRDKMASYTHSVLVSANISTPDFPLLEELDFSNINSVEQTIKNKS